MKIRDLFKYHNGILEVNWDFIETINEFNVLKTTQQSEKWHKEGNVFEHTKLVTNTMIKELTLNDVEKTSKYYMLMVAAALCHDLGKATTTKWSTEKNDYTCKYHSVEGARITRKLFFDENVDFREKLCSMVRWHMNLHHIFDDKDLVLTKLIDLSCWCRMPLCDMCLLNYCDSKGSINDIETEEMLNNKFNELEKICIENDIYHKPYTFINEQHRIIFYSTHDIEKRRQQLGTIEKTKHPFTIFMMIGLPGSGKDTYIKKHLSHLPTVCRDDIRIEMGMQGEKPTGTKSEEDQVTQIFNKKMLELCEQNQSFVINNTNLKKQYRDDYKKIVMKYNPYIIYIYVEAPTINDNKSRRNGQMPLSVIDRMIDNFDYPLPTEYHQMIFDIQDEYKDGIVNTKIEYVDDLVLSKNVVKKIIDNAIITRGAMILDGYEEEDSCVKYISEFIEDLKNELY